MEHMMNFRKLGFLTRMNANHPSHRIIIKKNQGTFRIFVKKPNYIFFCSKKFTLASVFFFEK